MQGSVTLPLRLAQHMPSAPRVAECLDKDPRIAFLAFPERGGSQCYPEMFREYDHLRLSIGLEDPADLLADIKAAFDETFA